MKITIIGSGNVASQIGLAFKNTGHSIVQLYSRNKKTASALSKKLNAEQVADIKHLTENTDLVLISVNDDSIASVISKIKLTKPAIVHTSGFTSMAVFKNKFKNYGVIYPVQTISASPLVNFSAIPICIEGNNSKTTAQLRKLASTISGHILKINSEKRQQLHLAAVLVNNFTNHLYTVSEELLKKNKISFKILLPLILNTTEKLKTSPAKKNQTGPAIRNDKKTMNVHLKLLQGDPLLKKIYKLLSLHISKKAKSNY